MYVIKKDNTKELFNIQKVVTAINKSATRCLYKFKEGEEAQICDFVEARVKDFNSNEITISQMHNVVEGALDAINPKVAKSYRDYRNYKQDFVAMLDEVYKKSQSIMYIGDKENSNTDSALVSTKRSLIFNELNKELYKKFFLTTEELQAIRDGYIYIHDMSARRDTMNCCLFDVKSVLEGGFEMGNLWYNEPKTLDVAFDVIGDITLSAASQQYGGFNQGVVTLNLADAGLSANHKLDNFWKILDERLELCKEALMLRHESLKGTLADVSPIHWRYGALARLESGEPIDKLLENGYSTISLGYIGLYECVVALIGQTHTSKEGNELATKIMERLRSACDSWKEETGLGFGLYGTPAESTTYTFARALKKRFGIVEGITDKDYLTNSYHVNVKEHIDAFDKLQVEAKFQKVSSGGAISYVEVTNMSENLDALSALIDYMYNTIQYAEINTKSDYCQECGFDGEILLDENREWYCPNCGNRNHKTLNVCRRTCGYLGDNFWNQGRTQEIAERFVHLDNHLYGE